MLTILYEFQCIKALTIGSPQLLSKNLPQEDLSRLVRMRGRILVAFQFDAILVFRVFTAMKSRSVLPPMSDVASSSRTISVLQAIGHPLRNGAQDTKARPFVQVILEQRFVVDVLYDSRKTILTLLRINELPHSILELLLMQHFFVFLV